MNLQELSLIPPEWDAQISDDELERLSAISPSPDGTIYGLSAGLYAHLPRTQRIQLFSQQKYIDTLVKTLLGRLEGVNLAPALPGASFYNDATGRDLHLLCKAITRAKNQLKIHLERSDRHKLVKALFEFVTRHRDSSLVFHPKTLRTSSTLLISLSGDEFRYITLNNTYKGLQAKHLVPKLEEVPISPLRLPWQPLYEYVRSILGFDRDRLNSEHFQGEKPVDGESVMELVATLRFFFEPSQVSDLFSTIFPLISPAKGATLAALLKSHRDARVHKEAKDLDPSKYWPRNTNRSDCDSLVDYLERVTKLDDATLLMHFLPFGEGMDSVIDYESVLDQIFELWPLVADSRQWDRAILGMANLILKNTTVAWKPAHIRMIMTSSIKSLRLATAGTAIPSPGDSSASPVSAVLIPSSTKPSWKVLGSLMTGLLAANIRSEFDSSADDSQASYSATTSSSSASNKNKEALEALRHWLLQVETYFHPNNNGKWTSPLTHIFQGIVSELSDRLKAKVIVQDFERYKGEWFDYATPSQGHYNFFGLPNFYHANVDLYLIRDDVWDELCPIFDRIRLHVAGTELGRDLTFLLAHIRPSYIHSSIFPRIFFTVENPMLGGRLHLPSSIELLSLMVPLLLRVQTAPTRLMELLDPLLAHIDPNDTNKSSMTFDFVLALVLGLNERKLGRALKNTALAKVALPQELKHTVIAKAFSELKQRRLHQSLEPNTYAASTEEAEAIEAELVSLESFVHEWCVVFFDRTLEFLDGIPSSATVGPNIIHCVQAVARFVDDSTFELLLGKLNQTIADCHSAKTALNPIVDAFTQAKPAQVIHACLEHWLSEVKKRANPAKKAKQSIESEVESAAWKLDLLRLVCKRFGMGIGSHDKALIAFIEPLLKDDDKRIRRAALRVLVAALGPFKTSCLTHENTALTGAGNSPSFIDVMLDYPTFVGPTKDSLELASRWIEHFVKPVLQVISEATKSLIASSSAATTTSEQGTPAITTGEASTTVATVATTSSTSSVPAISLPKELPDQLKLVFEFVSALGPVLPIKRVNTASAPSSAPGSTPVSVPASPAPDSLSPPTSTASLTASLEIMQIEKKKEDALLPLPLSVSLSVTDETSLPENLRSLRQQVIETANAFIAAGITTGKCQDGKIVRNTFKVLFQALSHNGAKETKWAEAISRLTTTAPVEGEKRDAAKAKRIEAPSKQLSIAYPARYTLSPLHPYYSPWRVNKSSTMMKDRWSITKNKLAFGKHESDAVKAFIQVSAAYPELIRSFKLLRIIGENVPRFSGATSFLNGILYKTISVPLEAHQSHTALLGSLALLASPFALNNMVSNWKNFESLVKFLRGLHIHDHAMIQQTISGLFCVLLSRIRAMPASPSQQEQGAFAAYTRIMDILVSDLTTARPQTHWRFHLYTVSLLNALLRKNIHTPSAIENKEAHPGLDATKVMQLVIPLLTDVLPSARILGRHMLKRLLRWAQESGDESHAAVVAPLLTDAKIDVLLSQVTLDRQLKRSMTATLEAVIESSVLDVDYTGSIGDAEWGLGSENVSFGTFSLRQADFWTGAFNAIKSLPSKDDILASVIAYLNRNILANLSAALKTTSASPSPSPVTDPAAGPSITSVATSTVPGAASSSLSPPPIGASASPSISVASPSSISPSHNDNAEEAEKHFYSLMEALSGLTRAFPDRAQKEVWPALTTGLRLSANRVSSVIWASAYLINYNVSLSGFETTLLEPLLTSGTDFGGVSTFDIETRLTWLLCMYQESRLANLQTLTSLVHNLFMVKKVASSSRPHIRTGSARLLSLLSAHVSRAQYDPERVLESSKVLNQVLEMLMQPVEQEPEEPKAGASAVTSTTAATGSMVPTTPEDRIKSAFLTWVMDCVSWRIDIVLRPEWWTRIMSQLGELVVAESSATAKTAGPILTRFSQLVKDLPSDLNQVEIIKQLENIQTMAKTHQRWKARLSLCFVLRLFCFNHALLIPASYHSDIFEWSKQMIADPNVDVRKAATAALSSLIRSLVTTSTEIASLVAHFLKIVNDNNKKTRTKLRLEKEEAPSGAAEAVSALQVGLAGLVALMSSAPYDVPPWLPDVILCLLRLSSHNNGAISTTASEAVTQFWKTHRDEWQFYKACFTEDQLRILEDKPVPSYYA